MKPAIIFSLTVCLLMSINLFSQCLLDKSGWSVVFEDEFEYSNFTELDASNKWYYRLNWPHDQTNEGNVYEDQLYVDDQFGFTGTSIILKADKLATPEMYYGKAYNWHSALLRAKHTEAECGSLTEGFTFGLFEIRCKMPAPSFGGQNLMWPAFWMFNGPDEIDIFEYHTQVSPIGRNFRVGAIDHNADESCGRSYLKNDGMDLSQEFNTYSVVWEGSAGAHPALLTFFFNERELFTMQSSVVPLNCPEDLYANLAVEVGSTATHGEFEIDYIRVYQKADYSSPYKTNEHWGNAPLDYDFNNLHRVSVELNSLTHNPTSSKVIYRDFEDKLQYYYYSGGGWYHGFVDFGQTGGKLVDGDVITANSDRIFYRGADNKLHSYFYSGSWNHFLVSSTHTVSSEPNSIALIDENNLFFRGLDNKLYYAHYSPTTWTIEVVNSGTSYLCDGDVEALSSTKIFYKGTDDYIHYFIKSGGLWVHNWIESSTAPNSTKINFEPNSLVLVGSDVYFKGKTDEKLHKYTFDGTNYNHSIISPLKAGNTKIKGNMRPGPGTSIYYIGIDDKAQFYNKEGAIWKHYYVSNYFLYDPHVYHYFDVSTLDGSLFYPDEGEHVFSYYWTTCEQLNPGCTNPDEPDFDLPEYIYRQIKVEETYLNNQISVYPNPAANYLQIGVANNTSNGLVKIYDLQGELVYDNLFTGSLIDVDISNLALGIFIVDITLDNVHQSKLFVKN